MTRLVVSACAGLALAILAVACEPAGLTDPPPVPVPAEIQEIGGNIQNFTVGKPLPEPLVVRVVDSSGAGVPNAVVGWSVSSGGGAVSAASSTTDSGGRAQVDWSLGTTPGAQSVRAVVAGVPFLTFTATAVPDLPAIILASSDSLLFDALEEERRADVTFQDGYGNVVTPSTISYTLEGETTGVALVLEDGRVRALAPGRMMLAIVADTASLRLPVHVAPVIAAVSLAEEPPCLGAIGDTVRLSATPIDANGHRVADARLTWISASPDIAAVDSEGTVTAAGNGSASITARAQNPRGEATATVPICVTQVVARVIVQPRVDTLNALGRTLSLRAEGRDAAGIAVSGASFAWSVIDVGWVEVDDVGMVTAREIGTGRIQVSSGGAADTAYVVVRQIAAGVSVSSPSDTLRVGDELQLALSVVDSAGAEVSAPAAVWSSSAPEVASIDAEGRVRALSAGAVEISAEVNEARGTISIVVASQASKQAGRLVVSPHSVRMALDEQASFTAAVITAAEDTVPVSATWSVSDTTRARIQASADDPSRGDLVSLSAGPVWVRATAGELTDSAHIVILDDELHLIDGSGGTEAVGGGRVARVRLLNGLDRPSSGRSVVWSPGSGGSVSAEETRTGEDGVAEVVWTLGLAAGEQILMASVSGALGSPVLFEVTSLAAAPSHLDFAIQPQDAEAGQPFTVEVLVLDAYGNRVQEAEHSIALAITEGTGSAGAQLEGVVRRMSSAGSAIFADLSITAANEGYMLTAMAEGLEPGASEEFAIRAGMPAALVIAAGNAQTAPAGSQVETAPSVRVLDPYGNPVRGLQVTFVVESGGGSVTGSAPTTGSDGVSTVGGWTLGSEPGENTLRAWAEGLESVLFTGVGSASSPVASWRLENQGLTDVGFTAVWGASGSEMFAGGSGGAIVRFDGTSATPMESGVTSNINAIWGLAADDVYAVGDRGVILHFDGSSWSARPEREEAPLSNLLGIWGTSRSNLYVLSQWGQISRFNGNNWHHFDQHPDLYEVRGIWGLPGDTLVVVGDRGFIRHYVEGRAISGGSGASLTEENLAAVWGTAYDNIFAVSVHGSVFRFDGTRWSAVWVATDRNRVSRWAIWGSSPSDVFVVGSEGEILHFDGDQWSRMESGISGWLNAVWGSSGTEVYAFGSPGLILRYDGSAWSRVVSGHNLFGVWAGSPSNVITVGAGGAIRHFDGVLWHGTSSGGPLSHLNGVWGLSEEEAFAVGAEGRILRFNGTSWQQMPSGSSRSLNAVWGTSSDFVIAVGSNGEIVRFDGTSWQRLTSGATQDLRGVWGTGTANIYAVGDGSTIVHYDGERWNRVSGAPAGNYRAVWGTSAGNVFAVGEGGLIAHFDGEQWTSISRSGTYSAIWGTHGGNVYVAGDQEIARYDGVSWTRSHAPGVQLRGVHGLPSGEIWAVGRRETIIRGDP